MIQNTPPPQQPNGIRPKPPQKRSDQRTQEERTGGIVGRILFPNDNVPTPAAQIPTQQPPFNN